MQAYLLSVTLAVHNTNLKQQQCFKKNKTNPSKQVTRDKVYCVPC